MTGTCDVGIILFEKVGCPTNFICEPFVTWGVKSRLVLYKLFAAVPSPAAPRATPPMPVLPEPLDPALPPPVLVTGVGPVLGSGSGVVGVLFVGALASTFIVPASNTGLGATVVVTVGMLTGTPVEVPLGELPVTPPVTPPVTIVL